MLIPWSPQFSARWLTGLGFRHTYRYLAGTIGWNACKLLLLLILTAGDDW